MVSRAAAASEKFIRAGRSFPGSTVDDEGLPLLSVFQLDPKCCERLLHSPAIGELGCTVTVRYSGNLLAEWRTVAESRTWAPNYFSGLGQLDGCMAE